MLVDAAGVAVEPVRWWLRELVLGDQSSLTVRSYAYALLTWHRVLWFVDVAWDRAAESDTAALVGWMRSARNPQRRGAAVAGTVNVRTGKPSPAAGYSAATINLTLAAVHGFYEFHRRQGRAHCATRCRRAGTADGRWRIAARWSRCRRFAGVASGRSSSCGRRARSRTRCSTSC
ncbi:hypothetical protein ACFQV8_01645 [Pseudonocardia benzenivorans]